jgi:hypothetical protein
MCVTKVIKYNIFILIYTANGFLGLYRWSPRHNDHFQLGTACHFPMLDLFTACRNRLELSPLDCRKLYITTIYARAVFVQIRWENFSGGEVWKLVLGSKTKGKSSGKHQFQWWDVPWIHFSETTSENRDHITLFIIC